MSSSTAAYQAKKEKVKAIMKARGKKDNSLPIMIMESDLYDHNPGARMTLLVLALGTRTNPEAWVQEDCPRTAEEMLGWCDMSQWRLSLRVGKSRSQVHRDIMMFEKDGVVKIDRWTDDNNANHDMYQINEDVIREHQRPAQKPDVVRQSRYKVKRGANRRANQKASAPMCPHHRAWSPIC